MFYKLLLFFAGTVDISGTHFDMHKVLEKSILSTWTFFSSIRNPSI